MKNELTIIYTLSLQMPCTIENLQQFLEGGKDDKMFGVKYNILNHLSKFEFIKIENNFHIFQHKIEGLSHKGEGCAHFERCVFDGLRYAAKELKATFTIQVEDVFVWNEGVELPFHITTPINHKKVSIEKYGYNLE